MPSSSSRRQHRMMEVVHHDVDSDYSDDDEEEDMHPVTSSTAVADDDHDTMEMDSDLQENGSIVEGEQEEPREYMLTEDAQLDILEQRAANAIHSDDRNIHREFLARLHDNYMHWQQRLMGVELSGGSGGDQEDEREDERRQAVAEVRKYFGRLRTARNARVERTWECDETFWTQWITDEQQWWILGTSEEDENGDDMQDSGAKRALRGVVRPLSGSGLKELFDRAVQECPCMPSVWQMYCEFMIASSMMAGDNTDGANGKESGSSTGPSAAFDQAAVKQVFDRAIDACGHHMSQCQTLWSLYREWAAALPEDEEETVLGCSGQEFIYRLFEKQLSIPHFDIDRTWDLYREWETDESRQSKTELLYARGVQLMRDRVEYETTLHELAVRLEQLQQQQQQQQQQEAPPAELRRMRKQHVQAWLKYLAFEKKRSDSIQRTLSLYERAVHECSNQGDTIWKDYLNYLEERADSQDPAATEALILSVCERAVRSCPSSVALWTSKLVNQEFLACDLETMQKTFDGALEKVQRGTLVKVSDFEELSMTYCGYLKRLAEASPDGEQLRALLRETFQQCSEQLVELFPDKDVQCSVQLLWAHLEAVLFQNVEAARQVFEQHVITPYGSKHAKHWINYVQFEIMFVRDIAYARALFQRGVYALESPHHVQQLGQQWTEFEQMWGNHVNYMHYAKKTTKQRIAQIATEKSDKLKPQQKRDTAQKRKGEKTKTKSDKKRTEKRKPAQDTKKSVVTADPTPERQEKKRPHSEIVPPAKEQEEEKEDDERQPAKKQKTETEEGKKRSKGGEEEVENAEELTLFLWNLPYTLEADALKEAFEKSGCTVEKIRIVKDHRGAPRGFAYMDVRDQDSVQRALQLDGHKINKRTMRVSISKPPKTSRDKEEMRRLAQKEKEERAKKQLEEAVLKPKPRKRRGAMMIPRALIGKRTGRQGDGPQQEEQQQQGPMSNADFKALLSGGSNKSKE